MPRPDAGQADRRHRPAGVEQRLLHRASAGDHGREVPAREVGDDDDHRVGASPGEPGRQRVPPLVGGTRMEEEGSKEALRVSVLRDADELYHRREKRRSSACHEKRWRLLPESEEAKEKNENESAGSAVWRTV